MKFTIHSHYMKTIESKIQRLEKQIKGLGDIDKYKKSLEKKLKELKKYK